MNPIKVLFVCIHNSARSQMAEAYLKKFGGAEFEAESAGLEPGTLNPVVVEVMKEDGIDISGNKTKSAFNLHKQGRHYDYVITVCDESQAEKCPVYPGVMQKIHWSFRDPSSFEGNLDEKLARTREVRDEIKVAVQKWASSLKQCQEEK